jgi:archaellum component FlaC
MSIEDHIKTLAKQELEESMKDIENRLNESLKQENTKLKEDLETIAEKIEKIDESLKEGVSVLTSQTKKENIQIKEELEVLTGKVSSLSITFEDLTNRVVALEEELHNRWSLVVKLRKYTLDQLMSEYKRLTGSMRPEKEELDENAES